MRFAALLILLSHAAPAGAQERGADDVARAFLAAHRAGDAAEMSIVAAHPARSTPYALAIQALLEMGEDDSALALARARAAGPEGEGLLRIVETYRQGGRPSHLQLGALQRAERRIERREGPLALVELEGAGGAIEGTIFGARVLWARGRALDLDQRPEDARAAYAACARAGREVGWLRLAREAQRKWLALARGGAAPSAEAVRAAEAYVETNERLDDQPELLTALGARAQILLAAGEAARAREDYARAIELARQLGERRSEALLLGSLAFLLQTREGMPRQARTHYERAVEIAREVADPALLQQCLFNLSTVSTQMGTYTAALATLDELLGPPAPPAGEMRLRALLQRAYVLRRLGRIEKGLAAYREAYEAMPDDRGRVEMEADLGDLQLERGALHEAGAHFDAVLAARPGAFRALAGKAGIAGLLGREAESDALFASALADAKEGGERGRIHLQHVAILRQAGRTGEARLAATAALAEFERGSQAEYGNAAAAWALLADLLLLDGEQEGALHALAQASVFFTKLQEPGLAIPALARETKVLLGAGMDDPALARLSQVKAFAAGTGDKRLKAVAKTAEAVVAGSGGAALWREAADLAHEAGDRHTEATALAHLALLSRDLSDVRAALRLLDGAPEQGAEWHPDVIGERPDVAPSIGLSLLLEGEGEEAERAAQALPLLERARYARLEVALRGRDAVLVAGLDRERYRAYVDARSRLREARAEGEGVERAVAAFDSVVEGLRAAHPAVATLAFPRAPNLSDLRQALREDEALLLMLQDSYVTALFALDRERVLLRAFDPKDPLAAAAPLLEGKRVVILAPDGGLGLATFAWKKGMALDAFEVHLVSSAASFLRQRRTEFPAGARGLGVRGEGPSGEAVAEGGRARLLWLGGPIRLDLSRPPAGPPLAAMPSAETTFAAAIQLAGLARPRAEAVWALGEALLFPDTRHAALALAGALAPATAQALAAECVGRGLPFPLALRAEQRKARRTAKEGEAPPLLGVVVYGVP